jgi:hypothetical protein
MFCLFSSTIKNIVFSLHEQTSRYTYGIFSRTILTIRIFLIERAYIPRSQIKFPIFFYLYRSRKKSTTTYRTSLYIFFLPHSFPFSLSTEVEHRIKNACASTCLVTRRSFRRLLVLLHLFYFC